MLDTLYQNILVGMVPETTRGIQRALDAGHDPGEILNQAMIGAMAEMGRRFEAGEMFVPEMLLAARAMKAGLTILKPHLVETGVEPLGKVVLGTVEGDLHDIGKNLVSMMLEGSGFEVIDVGFNAPPSTFVQAVQIEQPDLLGMSALLTRTMSSMGNVLEALAQAGLRDRVRVMVGGGPVTQAYADDIGADGYAPDAAAAVELARSLMLRSA